MNHTNPVDKMRGTWHRVQRLFRERETPRHANPYATLIPVIAALATRHHITRVVEFGGGFNSTPAFLDEAVFPALERLTTLENDKNWRAKLESEFSDCRHDIVSVEGEMALGVSADLLAKAEFILIDDSTCSAARAATIQAVIPHLSPTAILVIHDFEVADYKLAVNSIPLAGICNAICPFTGVLSKTPVVDRRWFGRINRHIGRSASRIDVANAAAWANEFAKF